VDDVVRSGRLFLTVAAAAAAASLGGNSGCGGRDAGPVGISTPRAAERVPRSGATDPSPVPADFRARLSRVSDRFLSEGHGDGFDAVVWSNEAARAEADAGGAFADGAMLVEEAIGRDALDGGAAAGLLVMEKRADAWRFVAVGPDGDVVSDARVAPCAQCHRDAPRDFVFRTPNPAQARQSSSAAASAATTATAPTTVATAAATYDARSAGSADVPSRR
jgi:Cytochrome P460